MTDGLSGRMSRKGKARASGRAGSARRPAANSWRQSWWELCWAVTCGAPSTATGTGRMRSACLGLHCRCNHPSMPATIVLPLPCCFTCNLFNLRQIQESTHRCDWHSSRTSEQHPGANMSSKRHTNQCCPEVLQPCLKHRQTAIKGRLTIKPLSKRVRFLGGLQERTWSFSVCPSYPRCRYQEISRASQESFGEWAGAPPKGCAVV